jgi:hypothetical protein
MRKHVDRSDTNLSRLDGFARIRGDPAEIPDFGPAAARRWHDMRLGLFRSFTAHPQYV